VSGPLLALLVAIEVRGTGDCPAPGEVARRLAPLLDADSGVAPDVAVLDAEAGSLRVTLRDSGGRPIGERRLPRSGSCADQAETVAVTLAIWEAQVHPEIALHLDRLNSPPPPPAVSASAAPPRLVLLGAAAAGDWQPGSWAPAGRLELGLGRAAGRWRWHLALLGIGPHTLALGPGQARWWRAAGTIGADGAVARGEAWSLVLGGGPVVGAASISGQGYSVDRTSRSVDVGGELRARLERARGVFRPWLGAGCVGWLRRQTVELAGLADTSQLPRVEPSVALGADLAW
jgi:hypothetical protein